MRILYVHGWYINSYIIISAFFLTDIFEYLRFLGLGAKAGRRGGKPVHLPLLLPPPS